MEHESPISSSNDWIQTHRGAKFHFWGSDPDEIHIEDVARGLAQTARWRGQYRDEVDFYSVAQHSVLGTQMAPSYAKKCFLLHDGAEWPLGDMAKPIKGFLPDYRKLENHIFSKIAVRFRVPVSDRVLKTVKIIDNWLLWSEAEQLLTNPALLSEWQLPRLENPWAPKRFKIRPWSPKESEKKFLQTYEALWNVKPAKQK